MRAIKSRILTLLAIISIAAIISACGQQPPPPPQMPPLPPPETGSLEPDLIPGRWDVIALELHRGGTISVYEFDAVREFFADGTGTFIGYQLFHEDDSSPIDLDFTWTASEGHITITGGWGSDEFEFYISDTSFVLNFDDGDQTAVILMERLP